VFKKKHLLASARRPAKGGRKKNNDESNVHLPQLQKKVVTYFILFLFLSSNVFIAFLGVLKQGEFKNATKVFFQKNPSGLIDITNNAAFFPSVFFPPFLGCFARFFYRVFGRFVTTGVQKRD
jgi:hypothetical protein